MQNPHPLTAATTETQNAFIGTFEVGREIGRGSFATVYKGHHTTTRALVAVKSVLRSKLTKKLLGSLESEISILKAIRHDHIVELVDCVKSDTHIHLVMEYCSLGDLSNYIKKRGDIPGIGRYPNAPPVGNQTGGLNEYVVRHFLRQLASALEFLRSHNLIHRDLKPQNLLLLPPPAVERSNTNVDRAVAVLPYLKIADFGFARSLTAHDLAETLCGSPLYMAPEILRYEKYDAKADLWSVGAVLYEMLSGKPPFRAQNHVELLRRIDRGGDRIRFPGEADFDVGHSRSSSANLSLGSSPSQLLVRQKAERERERQVSLAMNPPVISEEMKSLVRRSLKRNPVERISFADFFNHETIRSKIKIPRQSPPTNDTQYISTSTPANVTFPRHSMRSSPPSRRQPSDKHHSISHYQASLPDAYNEAYYQRVYQAQNAHGKERSAQSKRPSISRNATVSPLIGRRGSAISGELQMFGGGGPSPVYPARNHAHHSTHQHDHAGYSMGRSPIDREADSPSRSRVPPVEHYPQRRVSEIGPSIRREHEQQYPTEGGSLRPRAATVAHLTFDDPDSDYVVVEKRTVEVNALADELAASPSLAPPLHRSRSARDVLHFGTPAFSSSAPTRSPLIPSQYASRRRSRILSQLPDSVAILSTSPPFMEVTSPPQQNANTKDLIRSQSSPVFPTAVQRRNSGWSRNTATSVLAKALSTASARLFGNTSLKNAGLSAAAAAAAGLGLLGTSPPFLFGDRFSGLSGMAMVLFDGRVDPKEESVLKSIESYAQQAYVIFQFAESKMSGAVPPSPTLARIPGSSTSTKNTPSPLPTTSPPSDTTPIEVDQVALEEALVLFIKALSVLQVGMDEARRYWTTVQTEGSIAQQVNPSARLNTAVQWTRECFNECLEKAEVAKSKCVAKTTKDPEHCAEKLIYDRVAEISRSAAVKELAGDDLFECEMAYRTALLLLRTLKDGPFEDGYKLEDEDREVLSVFSASIKARLETLKRRVDASVMNQASLDGLDDGDNGSNTEPTAKLEGE